MRYYVQDILDGILANFEIAFRTVHAVDTRIRSRTAIPISVPIHTSLITPSPALVASEYLGSRHPSYPRHGTSTEIRA